MMNPGRVFWSKLFTGVCKESGWLIDGVIPPPVPAGIPRSAGSSWVLRMGIILKNTFESGKNRDIPASAPQRFLRNAIN